MKTNTHAEYRKAVEALKRNEDRVASAVAKFKKIQEDYWFIHALRKDAARLKKKWEAEVASR